MPRKVLSRREKEVISGYGIIMETQKVLHLILLYLDVILCCVKYVNNANFIPLLKNPKDHEIVPNRVFTIALEPQQWIVAERMGGRDSL